MRLNVETDFASITVLTLGLLAIGWAGDAAADRGTIALMASSDGPGLSQEMPENWIREFDRRRQRLLERLDNRMEELRRRIDRRTASGRGMLAA